MKVISYQYIYLLYNYLHIYIYIYNKYQKVNKDEDKHLQHAAATPTVPAKLKAAAPTMANRARRRMALPEAGRKPIKTLEAAEFSRSMLNLKHVSTWHDLILQLLQLWHTKYFCSIEKYQKKYKLILRLYLQIYCISLYTLHQTFMYTVVHWCIPISSHFDFTVHAYILVWKSIHVANLKYGNFMYFPSKPLSREQATEAVASWTLILLDLSAIARLPLWSCLAFWIKSNSHNSSKWHPLAFLAKHSKTLILYQETMVFWTWHTWLCVCASNVWLCTCMYIMG